MNGIMKESVIVKEYQLIKPPIHKIESIIDDCIRDCHNKYFNTFDHLCVYDINLTKITNNEIVDLTIPNKSKNLYELNKRLENARQNGFILEQRKKFTQNFL